MHDPIELKGGKQEFKLQLTGSLSGEVPCTLKVQGMKGLLTPLSEVPLTSEEDPAFAGGAVDAREEIIGQYLLEGLIDEAEEEDLEMEMVQIFQLDPASAVVDPMESNRMQLEFDSNEFDYAMLVQESGEMLSWVLPEEEEESDFQTLAFEASAIQPQGSLASASAAPKRSIFSVFRWFKKKVIRNPFIKDPGFHHYSYERAREGKRPWRKIKNGGDWKSLNQKIEAGGKTLLLIHGFLGGPKNFKNFLAGEPKRLEALYGERIIAYRHPSLFRTPKENAEAFYKEWEGPEHFDLDIFTRSRGSLVYRQIVEQQAADWQKLKINLDKVIMLAGPNEGTPMARPENIFKFLNTLTNILARFTGPTVGVAIRLIPYLLKLGRRKNKTDLLRGLFAMDDQGDYIKELNTLPVGGKNYFALSVNTEPQRRKLRSFADLMIDPIFGSLQNDWINPTLGAGGTDSADKFEVETFLIDSNREDIHHLNYFKHDSIRKQVVDWMELESPQA